MKVTLKAARVNAGISQMEAANGIGVNIATIWNWEKGKTSPSLKKFKMLCDLYGCTPDDIRMETEE